MVTTEEFIEAEEWTGKEGRLPNGKYTATWDAIGGCWNIGPGLTKGVTGSTSMSRQEIDAAYAAELVPFEKCVANNVKVPLAANQRTALVSFAYNVGESDFCKSTLLRGLNAGKYDSVPVQLKRWVHGRATGKEVIPGLVNRRNAEIKLWGTPDKSAPVETPGLSYDPPIQAPAHVPQYDPSCPVPKGAATLEMVMSELATMVNVPIQATTAVISQVGHKVITATQGGFLAFVTYVLANFNDAWSLVGVNSHNVSVFACTALIAAIEWYKHEWIANSNDTTRAIVDSLEKQLQTITNEIKG